MLPFSDVTSTTSTTPGAHSWSRRPSSRSRSSLNHAAFQPETPATRSATTAACASSGVAPVACKLTSFKSFPDEPSTKSSATNASPRWVSRDGERSTIEVMPSSEHLRSCTLREPVGFRQREVEGPLIPKRVRCSVDEIRVQRGEAFLRESDPRGVTDALVAEVEYGNGGLRVHLRPRPHGARLDRKDEDGATHDPGNAPHALPTRRAIS